MPHKVPLVIVESPFKAETPLAKLRNVAYARLCVRDCLNRGEIPLASHLLYTQPGILDDDNPEERRKGLNAGWAMYKLAKLCVVYEDLGFSPGMNSGIQRAFEHAVAIEYRKIRDWENLIWTGAVKHFPARY